MPQGDSFVSIYGVIGSAFDDVLRIGNAGGAIFGNTGNDWLIGGNARRLTATRTTSDRRRWHQPPDRRRRRRRARRHRRARLRRLLDRRGRPDRQHRRPSGNLGDATGDSFISIYGIVGSQFDDVLRIGNAGGAIFGNNGDDTLIGGTATTTDAAAATTLIGGGGINHLIGGSGADVLDGSGGLAFADYAGRRGPDRQHRRSSGNVGDATGDSFISIYGIVGSLFDDVLRIGNAGGAIFGNDGNDWLIGGNGADSLIGGRGINHLIGGAGADTLDGTGGLSFADYSTAAAA
jgi:Ca2+-binding RTX toxin-like protein